MAASGLPAVPPSLKSIQHYLKTAAEHDKRDPVISYYCRLYAVQKAISIDKNPEAKAFLFSLMDNLEKAKLELKEEEAIGNDVVAQAYVENHAINLFTWADTEDRAGRFNKNVVKSFYTAGMLMDVLSTFGEPTEEIQKMKKYAKWKAAYIHKCLKTGETPIAGPMPEEGDDEGLEAGGGAAAPVGFENIPGPSVPPSHMPINPDATSLYPAPGAHAPPSTPQDPQYGTQPSPQSHPAYQPSPQRSPQPAPRGVPSQRPAASPTGTDWTPPPNPAGIKLTAEQYQKGIKFCKYASSAMQYEDSATAIANLTKALKLLTTGTES